MTLITLITPRMNWHLFHESHSHNIHVYMITLITLITLASFIDIAHVIVILILMITLVMCVIQTFLEEDPWYMYPALEWNSSYIFLSFIILFNTLIPLSMYVSLELARYCNKIWVETDASMTHQNISSSVRNTNIIEELGQVQYVFSDKTGTLTCNDLEFAKCCVGSVVYPSPELASNSSYDPNNNPNSQLDDTKDISISSVSSFPSVSLTDNTDNTDNKSSHPFNLTSFGSIFTDAGSEKSSEKSSESSEKKHNQDTLSSPSPPSSSSSTLEQREQQEERRERQERQEQIVNIQDFVLILAMCNTVTVAPALSEKQPHETAETRKTLDTSRASGDAAGGPGAGFGGKADGEGKQNNNGFRGLFQGSSMDEVEFVCTAAKLG